MKLLTYAIKSRSARPGHEPGTSDMQVQRSTDMAMPLRDKWRNN